MGHFSSFDSAVIVGTSNSILKGGYTEPVKEAYKEVVNLSLGASAYTLLAFRAPEVRQFRDRIVILDLAVTDAAIHGRLPTNFAMHRSVLEGFLGDCVACNHLPVIHIMPSAWQSARHGVIYKTYKEYAERYGLPFFDGFAFVERLYQLRPELTRFGYVVAAHIDVELARMIGRCLTLSIDRFKQQMLPDDESTRTTWISETRNLTKDVPAEMLVARKTSLDSRDFVSFLPGTTLTVPAPEGATLIGLAINAAASNAVLSLAGERRILKETRNALYRGPDKYIFGVWQVRDGLAPKAGEITVGSRRELAAGPDEQVESIEAPHPNCDMSHVTIELESLVFLRQGESRPMRRLGPAAFDLLASLSDEDILAASRVENV